MSCGPVLSRPLRLAARVREEDEEKLEHVFASARLLVRLEEGFEKVADARECFLLAVNGALRFCPNIAVSVARATELLEMCDALASAVYGSGHRVHNAKTSEVEGFSAT